MEENGQLVKFIFSGTEVVAEEESDGNVIRYIRGLSLISSDSEKARFYNPVIGRFMQEDTYRGDGLNLFSYCQNNPLMYYDPSGHAARAIWQM